MFKKLRNLKFYSHLAFATMVLSGAGAANAADAWNPIGDYDLYVRNNTQKTYATDVLVNIIGGCDGASYPLGYGALFAYFTPGNTSKLIDVTGPIDCPTQKWEFTILDPVDPGSSLRFMAYFALSGAMGAPGMAAPMRTDGFSVSGFQHDVWFTARDKFYDTGAYVTIGTNYFGDLGPTRTSTTDNTLTVSPDCTTLDTAWAITLTQSGYAGKTRYFSGGSFYSGSYASTEGAASQTIGTETVTYYSRSYLHQSGSYITIGNDNFGKLGPSVTSEYSNTLMVTTFNTFLGTDDKPEACTRGQYLQSVLKTLSTDVLLLQDLNYRDDSCDYDGHDLVSYLWTGVQNQEIADDSYAGSDSGSGTSPKKTGAFPYISQMTSGVATGGDEKNTGGGIILSKYPLEMIANKKFSNCPGSCGDEDKGFIVVKITKNGKSYFLINTHTYATNQSIRETQFAEIATWINDNRAILAGHRVILLSRHKLSPLTMESSSLLRVIPAVAGRTRLTTPKLLSRRWVLVKQQQIPSPYPR